MKHFYLILFILLSLTSIAQTTRYSRASGNWESSSTWTPTGVPSINDNIIIRSGHDIVVTGQSNCKNLELQGSTTGLLLDKTTLIINAGKSLSINGDLTQTASASLLAGTATSVTVLGVLNVVGNYAANNTTTILSSNNTLDIGNSTVAGEVYVQGNFTSTSTTTNLLFQCNTTNLYQGVLDVRGSVYNYSSGINLANTNVINIQDNGANSGKFKRFYLGGGIYNSANSGSLNLMDTNNDANYQFVMNGLTTQYIATVNVTYKDLIIANEKAEVQMVNNLSNTQIKGNVRVLTKAILNVRSYNLDGITAFANQIQLDSAGTLKIENEDGVPAQLVGGAFVLKSHPRGIVEYTTTSNLNVLKEVYDYPIVKLTGSGTKTLHSLANINNVNLKVGEIDLAEGTFEFPDGKNLQLNSTYGKRLMTMRANTVFAVLGSIGVQDVFFNIDRANTTNYTSNNEQVLYSFKSNATTIEPYGILMLSKTSGNSVATKVLPATVNVRVKNKLVFGSKAKLQLNQGSIMQLTSDASFTAYVAEIPSDASIEYLGTPEGKFQADRFITFPNDNYRDFSSPILGYTLKGWKDAGLQMTGFVGSNSPKSTFISAYAYDEANKGDLDQGFIPATNVTNKVHQLVGSNINRGAWRIYAGSSTKPLSLTLKDQGRIYYGDVNYKLDFTRGNFSRTNDDGWNFIGNPYPAAIDWKKVYEDKDNKKVFKKDGVQSTAYVWAPADKNNPKEVRNSYGFYNPVTGVSDGLTSVIPSFQGFWVKTYDKKADKESFDLLIKEEHKADETSSKFFKADSLSAPTTVQLALSGNQADSKLWFHLWDSASTSFDEMVDVPKLGNAPNDQAFLDFTSEKNELNLWVNALPKGVQSINFNVLVSTPAAGDYTLKISNLQKFSDEYGCVVILDMLTNKYIDLNDTVSYTFSSAAGFRADRFLISTFKTLSQNITTADATCFGNRDGKLFVNLSDINEDKNFTLFKNGGLFANYAGNIDKIDVNLHAGSYNLVNNTGFIGCLVNNYEFAVQEQPEVKSNFVIPAGLIRNGDAVTFINKASNASSFIWTFQDDNSTSTEESPVHTFYNPGFYKIDLLAIGANPNCTATSSRVISVADITGISDLNSPNSVLKLKDDKLVFIGNAKPTTLQVFDLVGKLLLNKQCDSGDCAIPFTKENGIRIVVVENDSEQYFYKIAY